MYQSVGTSFSTTFTYGNATSTTNLFNLTDTASNSGTGYLLNLTTAASSTLKPFHVSAAGVEALTVLANGNVGIGTTAPVYKLDVSGTANFSGAATTTAGGAAGVGTNLLATTNYVQSRTENLITNGSGLLLNNYNFSTFTFDSVETHGGAGSFRVNVSQQARLNDELIPVDPEKYYRLIGWGKSGDTGGANFNAANKQYLGVAQYDIDGNSIAPESYLKYSGSTDTTLAAQLNPGDNTITLTDATGWSTSGTGHTRNFIWYGYTNAKGYTYPNYTYSRTYSSNYSSNGSLGAWDTTGISGNVITLRVPWAGPTIAAGTAVRNNQSGGTYKYITTANTTVPNAWTRYEGYIGSLDTAGVGTASLFSYGTAYVKLLFLVNYHGAADNNVRWSDLVFTESSSRNLEVASATVPGIVSLANQSLGAGDKYFSGNVGIGTTAPGGLLDLIGSSNTAATLSLTNNSATTIGNGANTLGVLDLQSTSLTTGNFLNIETNALTSGKAVNITSTKTGITTGSLLNIANTGTYDPGAGNTGSLVNLSVIDGASNTSGNSIVNGINIASTISTSGATGTKAINALNIAIPTKTACTGGACTWVGLNIADPGTLANTTFYSALFQGGNVGIGTTAPASKLEIDTADATAYSTTAITTGTSFFYNKANGGSNGAISSLRLQASNDNGSNNAIGVLNLIQPTNGSADSNFAFQLRAAGGAYSEVMRILANGNVGIGTTAPGSILALGGTAARTFGMDRNTTAATAGQGFTISSGGAIAGTANLAGGDLTLKSGTSTGTGSSALHFFTATAGGSGTADNAPTEKLTILANGNVGIGITNPTNKLHIVGNIKATTSIDTDTQFLGQASDTVTAPSYAWTSDLTTGMWRPAASTIAFANGGVESLRINSSGNVGIGTTAPAELLHVKLDQNTATSGVIENVSAGTGAQAVFQVRNGTTVTDSLRIGALGTGFTTTGVFVQDAGYLSADSGLSGGLGIITRANAPIMFATNGHTNERMRINSAGNVGIGITNPTSLLHLVQSTANQTGITVSGYSLTGSANTQPLLDLSGTWNVSSANPSAIKLNITNTLSSTGSNLITLQESSSNRFTVNALGTTAVRSTNTSGATSNLGESTTAALEIDQAAGSANGYASLRFQEAGVTAASIVGKMIDLANNYGDLLFNTRAADGFNTRMTILSNGNVGIGTTGPDRKLDVLDASNPQLRLTQTDGSVFADLQTPSTGGLSLSTNNLTTSGAYGLLGTYTIAGTAASQTYYGNKLAITNSQTTNANTLYGQHISFTDAGSLANTVTGLYVDATTANTADTTYAAIFQGATLVSAQPLLERLCQTTLLARMGVEYSRLILHLLHATQAFCLEAVLMLQMVLIYGIKPQPDNHS